MIHVIARFVVRDVAVYVAAHGTSGLNVRQRHGCLASHLYRGTSDAYAMEAVLTWPSRAAFDAFEVDPVVRDCMRNGGMVAPPVFSAFSDADLSPESARAAGLEKIGDYIG